MVLPATVSTPAVVADLLEGLRSFVAKRVFVLHEEYGAILEDPRSVYSVRGEYSPAVLELMRQVRQESSEAGYYTMFAPEEFGGGGHGGGRLVRGLGDAPPRVRLAAVARVPGRGALGQGPGPLLRHLTPEAQGQVTPGPDVRRQDDVLRHVGA